MDFYRSNTIDQINAGPALIQAVDEKALTGSGTVDEVQYRIRGDSAFLWTKAAVITVSGSGAFRHQIFVASYNENLENNPVHSSNFWGTAQAPMKHPPKLLPLNAELTFRLEAVSGTPTIALFLIGHKANVCGDPRAVTCEDPHCRCDRWRWGQGRGLFVYHTEKAGIILTASTANLASGSGRPSVRIRDRYHFRASAICASATSASWRGNLEYKDPRQSRTFKLSDVRLRSAAWTGINTAPFVPSSPLVFEKGSDVVFDDEDVSGSQNTIHHGLIGEMLDDELLRDNA